MPRLLTRLTLAALLLCPLVAWAQYDHLLDASAFGQQVQASMNPRGLIEVQYTSLIPVFETVTKEQEVIAVVEVDGEKRTVRKTVEVPVTVCRFVTEMRTQLLPADGVEAYDMAGKPVDAEQVAKLLKEERTVLLASRKVPRYFLSVYKPDTLLLVMASSAAGTILPPPIGIPLPLPEPALVPPVAPRAVPIPAAPRPLPARVPVAPAPPAAEAPVADEPAVARAEAGAGPAASGLQPLVGLAKAGDDLVTIRRYVKNVSKETALREVTEGKETKQVPVEIEVESMIDVERKFPQRWLEVYRADGKAVDAADVNELLAKDVAVLVSADGKKIADRWLKIVKPETLIVLTPTAAPPVFGAPAIGLPPVAPPALIPAVGPPAAGPIPSTNARVPPKKTPKTAPPEDK